MTTAKRTPGDAIRDGTICAPGKLEIDLRLDDEGDHWITVKGPNSEANAEYIRKAWNLHDELVGFVESVIGFTVNLRQTDPNWQDHQDAGVLYAKATALLAKAQ